MLTEQNIEQYLFDYHEGTLDAPQKVELMEFLHQHPEWQREFAIWAQVRLHDEPVAAPILQKKILKSTVPKFPIWFSGLMVGATVAVGSALLLWYLGTTAPSTPAYENHALPTAVTSPSYAPFKDKEAEKEAEHTATEIPQIEIVPIEEEIRQIAPVSKEPTVFSEKPKEGSVSIDTAQVPELKAQEPVAVSSLSDSSKDDPGEPTPEVAPKKKKKRPKQKISLKPTSDIIPSNSNF